MGVRWGFLVVSVVFLSLNILQCHNVKSTDENHNVKKDPPSEPRNLTVKEIDNSRLLVRWEEPLNHGSPYLSGYELCYNSTCEQTMTETGTKLSLDRGMLYNISVYAISKSDNTTGKSPPTSMMFTMDSPHNFKVVDIGHNWVYLSWDKLNPSCGTSQQHYKISCTPRGETSFNFATMETSYNISELSTNISTRCSVVAISSDNTNCSLYSPHIVTAPGAGIVTEFPYHNKVIAHFVGDKNSARLSCTVMNGDVQTDTVWSVTYKNGTIIERIQDTELFKISGDRRQSSLESNFNYGNYLDIIDCSVKELDGAVISCGSYVNPSQANVSMLYVCDEPSVMSVSIINVWEGHIECSIDVMTSNLKISKHKLLKDKYDTRSGILVNGFSVTFGEVKKEDAGNYFAEFCIPCHKDSSPKCFNHTFYLNVMYGPTMSEVLQTKYLFSGGDQLSAAELVIGENLESNPEAVVTWTTPQGETFKESNGRYTMSSGPEKVQLSISGVSERDNGTWTVAVEVLSTETFKYCLDQKSSSRKKEYHIQVIVVVPPSEPLEIYVEQLNTTTVSVSWTEPSIRGSPHLMGYRLCYNSTCITTLDSNAFNGFEINLDEGKLYVITVYAISKSDNITRESHPATKMFTMSESNWTLYYMFGIGITTVIIYGMYMRQTSKRSKPGRPKPSQVLEDSVELIWEKPHGSRSKIDSYAVFFHSEHDPVGQWYREDTNNTKPRIEGLLANTTYTFKVCSLLKGKPGPESDLSEPITTCSAPQATEPN